MSHWRLDLDTTGRHEVSALYLISSLDSDFMAALGGEVGRSNTSKLLEDFGFSGAVCTFSGSHSTFSSPFSITGTSMFLVTLVVVILVPYKNKVPVLATT